MGSIRRSPGMQDKTMSHKWPGKWIAELAYRSNLMLTFG
jgi:hypothetical protein